MCFSNGERDTQWKQTLGEDFDLKPTCDLRVSHNAWSYPHLAIDKKNEDINRTARTTNYTVMRYIQCSVKNRIEIWADWCFFLWIRFLKEPLVRRNENKQNFVVKMLEWFFLVEISRHRQFLDWWPRTSFKDLPRYNTYVALCCNTILGLGISMTLLS